MFAWQIMVLQQRRREEEARHRDALKGAIVGAPAVVDGDFFERFSGEELFVIGMLGGRMA